MRPSRVRQRWNEGKPAFCVTNHLIDPTIAEMMSLMGFDCIWIDMEHQPTSVETAGQMMRGARVGVADVMARTGKGEFMRLGRMLECGAHGIMYPRCESAEEARQAVRWSKFAPMGERGFNGGGADMPYGSMEMGRYVKQANEQTFLVVQIESPAAVEHARAIAEVEGVDVVLFGPGDFSVLSGNPGQWDHEVLVKARARVARETLAAGKRFGTLAFDPAMARQVLDLGTTLVCHGVDMVWIKQAMEQIRRDFGPLGFVFDDRMSDGSSAYNR